MDLSSIDVSDPVKYLWIAYALFILIVVAVSLALFFHWHSYTRLRQVKFILAQLLYIFVLGILIMVSSIFFFKI